MPTAVRLAIEIPFDPDFGKLGPFLLTWHGLFTALGILGGVWLSLRVAERIHFDVDNAYTLALIGVPSGIIGARLLFVAEHWDFYGANPAQIIQLTEGGISIWGAVLGGVAGPLAYALWKGWDVANGLDAAAPGLILGMGIGRIGDLINGEHLSRATDLPWGVIYTHPNSPAFAHSVTVGAHHPATTYEMLGDFLILGMLLWLISGPFKRRPGLAFFAFLNTYAVMRFMVSYLRVDSAGTVLTDVTVPQLVSVIVVALSVPVAALFWRRGPMDRGPAEAASPAGRVQVRRA
ncbi:MAG: prolipoprotein diacylglyceryl transferase [Dehalococcoidia bacterium]|nr:prolipoprotein diacylglyceryl transferase [Dehalococcoidia bacterium]